jgi:hypothetical protein
MVATRVMPPVAKARFEPSGCILWSMLRLAVVASFLLALCVVPTANAKEFTKLAVVGDQGKFVELTGPEFAPWNIVAPGAEASEPAGGYVLLYPFMHALPMRPGRYFPEQRIACFSWARDALGECGRVTDDAAVQLRTAVTGLPRFGFGSAILTRFVLNGSERPITSNGAVALEFAFNVWQLAKPARKPKICTAVRATWSGPASASRPTRFCAAANGIWAAGRLYRMPGVLPWL